MLIALDVLQAEFPATFFARIRILYEVFSESPVTVTVVLVPVSAGSGEKSVQPEPESPQFEPVQLCTSYPVGTPVPVVAPADQVTVISALVVLDDVLENADGRAGIVVADGVAVVVALQL